MRARLGFCLPLPPAPVSPLPSDIPLRTAPFELEDRWLLWSRAQLYADRLTLTGWFLWGRYHRSVPLDRINDVEATDRHLVLSLADGSSLRVLMDAPEQWASAITTHRDVRER